MSFVKSARFGLGVASCVLLMFVVLLLPRVFRLRGALLMSWFAGKVRFDLLRRLATILLMLLLIWGADDKRIR